MLDHIVDSQCVEHYIDLIDELSDSGFRDLILVATHGVFDGQSLRRINECPEFKSVLVSDSIPQHINQKLCPKLHAFTVAPLYAQFVRKIVFPDNK